jgi:TATA-binding protein-associated factor Taf7
MENINVTLGIDNESLEKLSSILEESLKDSLAESIKNDIEHEIDVDDNISNWMDYNFDVEDHLRNVNINDYIDTESLEIPEVDIESEARNLLENYSPVNGCGTGEAFTNAVEKAVRYLLLKEDSFVENIANALEKRIEKQKKEEMKASIIEEMKPLLFDDFKAQIERYAAEIELQKAQEILSQTTAYVIPEIPTNNTGY